MCYSINNSLCIWVSVECVNFMRIGKSEAEISKWMRGTHNFTIDTLVSIEGELEAPIVDVCHSHAYPTYEFEPVVAAEP